MILNVAVNDTSCNAARQSGSTNRDVIQNDRLADDISRRFEK